MSHSQPHAGESSSWVSRLNLSQWALDHQAFTRYLMIVLMLLGVAAYFQLGQDEDPPFTFRAMVVRAFWPGATAQQVSEQVADRIEKTLQEVPYADKIRSYSKPGETLILFQVRDNAPSSEIQQTWYTVRKKVGDMRATLPQGVVGPFFNDEFGDVFGVIYALQGEGFTLAERKRLADAVRQKLLRVKDVNKVELFGAQDEKLFIEISHQRLLHVCRHGAGAARRGAGAGGRRLRLGGTAARDADPGRQRHPAAAGRHRPDSSGLHRSATGAGAPQRP
jgi:multidrug efflux pump